MANYDLYPLALRRDDNIYGIRGSWVHSHEFFVNPLAPTSLDVAAIMEEAQDGGLHAWFSTRPMGQQLFVADNLDEFAIGRTPRQIVLYNLAIVEPGDGRVGLATGIPYYFNVQNRTNSGNTYYLEFSF